MKLAKLGILHHLPIERYPPIQNLLDYLGRRSDVQVLVVSSESCQPHDVCSPSTGSSGINVLRISCRRHGILLRWLRTLLWHIRAAFVMGRFRPDVILSVEPHSALALWLHRYLFHSRARIVIQHYEYYSDADYRRPGNRLLRLNRIFERALLRQADRVTQTNPDRLRLFAADNSYLRAEQVRVWPNYPPESWFQLPERNWPVDPCGPLRLVLAGAVSLRDTDIEPLVDWISAPDQTRCTLDIYANSIDAETAAWLKQRCSDRLRFHAGGVAYSRLPHVLRTFDVGLILYRCRTANFVWNATNKLFEYLTCGLDVWYPPCMLGVLPYARTTAAPRVLETDFQKLTELDMAHRRTRGDLPYVPWTTSCEQVFEEVLAVSN